MTQIKQIADLLQASGSVGINQKDAIQIGCFRLASRINDLRNMGYIISTDKFGFGHLATYVLLDPPTTKFSELTLDQVEKFKGFTVDGDRQQLLLR